MDLSAKRIVIVGGGFAGVKCARTLSKKLKSDGIEIVIFNRENHMVFHPMLAEVVGGSLNPDSVAAPLRQMLPGVKCRTEEVHDIDLETKTVVFKTYDERLATLTFDHLILACGGDVNLTMVPGMADHAFAMKTVGDAVALRAHVMEQLEKAEVCEDEELRRWFLSFIIVGGGYSGVEVAGEINDLARSSRRYFQNIKEEDIEVTLIHSRAQLLPEIGEKLREFTADKMRQSGVTVTLNARASLASHKGISLKDGSEIKGATIVCTIGTQPAAVLQKLDVTKERGRPLTRPDMRLVDYDYVWAIGDCAVIVNSEDDKPSPPTGQFAERQGKQVAANIIAVFRGQETKPFGFKPLGQLCAIGGHKAVAEIMGFRLSGFFAWVLWRCIYVMKLPSWSRRFKAGFDWCWQLVFGRDLAHLKTDTTKRVSNAHYKPGDVIFAEGDPATNFYVIENGEVEIIRGENEVLATMVAGDFFGEMALLSDNPRNATVRAKTDVEVVVMGRCVFEQISESMAPLKELLTRAVEQRRSTPKE
ncbi:MAG: NADH dehydrogenase [Planctomycetota bacterium]|jgi:NADH dehydrogenase